MRPNTNTETCIVRVDRLQVLAWPRGDRLPVIPGFCVRRDSFVRPQTTVRTYRRVRNLQSPKTKTSVYAQYLRAQPWLAPVKLTIIAGARRGLHRTEVEAVAGAFRKVRLLLLELALDFDSGSEMDRAFVLRHGVFGRSRLFGGHFFSTLRYGSQKGPKLVRAYARGETDSYRVELELHSSWLRRYGIAQLEDLAQLPALLFPAHIRFVTIDWHRLEAHLSRKGRSAEHTLAECQKREKSLQRATSYLRDEVGLHNVHRFLRPLKINRAIREALVTWARAWHNQVDGSRS